MDKNNQEDPKACLQCLEDTTIALNDLEEEKKLLSIAMSSYYLLYR